MEQTAAGDNVNLRGEIVRKLIHLGSLSIPVVYYFIPRTLALELIVPVTVAFVLVDLARYDVPFVSGLFYRFFGFMLRKHEVDGQRHALNGASYLLISAVICISIFPKLIMVGSFTVLILADAASAVFGKRFGRHKIFPQRRLPKSYEGSLAFIIAGVLAVLLTPKVNYSLAEYVIGAASVGVASFAEVLSYGIVDDNLAIPISFGLANWALYVIFLPHLNVFFLG